MAITEEIVAERTQESQARALRRSIDRLESGVRGWFERVGGAIEHRQWLAIGILLAFYVPLSLMEAHGTRFLNDEVYTIHIARAPTLRHMLWEAREIDLHPPLHYLLQRLALHAPGPLWFTSRLPSLVAGLVATMALFWMTAPRLGNLLGMLSAAMLWTGPIAVFAWQNRPYMLWMAFLTLLVLAWRRATRDGRRGRDVAVVFVLSALLVSNQLIGALCLGAFVLSEAVRAMGRRRVDWLLLVALLSPAVVGFGLTYQFKHLGSNKFPPWQIPSFGFAIHMYTAFITQMFFLLSLSIVVAAYLGRAQRTALREGRPLRLPLDEGALYIGLMLVPIALMLIANVVKIQFWERYGASAVIGIAGFLPWMLYRRVRELRLVSTLMVLSFIWTMASQMIGESTIHDPDTASFHSIGRLPIWLGDLDPSMPIVDASPMTYMEMSVREPATITPRVYYLTNRALADKYAHYTLFENEEKIRRILELHSQAEDFQAFLQAHPRFYMVATFDRGTDWLPRALADCGADLDYLGKFVSRYDDDDLYQVTVRPEMNCAQNHGALPSQNAGMSQ